MPFTPAVGQDRRDADDRDIAGRVVDYEQRLAEVRAQLATLALDGGDVAILVGVGPTAAALAVELEADRGGPDVPAERAVEPHVRTNPAPDLDPAGRTKLRAVVSARI